MKRATLLALATAVTTATSALAAPQLMLSELSPIDPAPARSPRAVQNAAVASDGTKWLAVYGGEDALAANWVGADGAATGDGFGIGPDTGYVARPRVVHDGEKFLVAWQTYGEKQKDVGAQWITDDGVGPVLDLGLPLDEDTVAFDLTLDGNAAPRAMACGLHEATSSCQTALLSADGSVAHESFDLPFPMLDFDLAFSGDQGMALVETTTHAVVWVTLDSDGSLLEWSTLEPNTATGDGAAPTLVADGDGYIAAWHRKDGLRVMRLSMEGEIGGQQLVAGDGSFSRPTLLPTPDNLVLFSSKPSATCGYCTDGYVQSLPLALDSAASEAKLVAEGRISSLSASLAGASALLVSSGADQLEAALIDPKQLVTKPAAEPIAFRAPIESLPVLATAPEGWLVAWHEQDALRGALVDEAGAAKPITLELPGARQVPVALAEGDGGWLMVWSGDGTRVNRLDETGKSTSTAYPLTFPLGVRVVRSDDGWLVVWSHWSGQTGGITGDFFDFQGAHQNTLVIADGLTGNGEVAFDAVGAADGFQVAWSAAYGVGSLDIDATGHALRSPQVLFDPHAMTGLSLAKTTKASWLGYVDGTDLFFSALPAAPTKVAGSFVAFWSQLRPVGDVAVVAWSADDTLPATGHLSVAAADGSLTDAEPTFPTLKGALGFAVSEARGEHALLATNAKLEPFGFPTSRIARGVLTYGEPPVTGGAGGESAGGAGVVDPGEGGEPGTSEPNAGTAGTGASGGSSNGGEPANAGGEGGEANGQTPGAGKKDDGCDCGVVGASPSRSGAWLSLLLLAGVLWRRRRTAG